jgi:hypothetical protein
MAPAMHLEIVIAARVALGRPNLVVSGKKQPDGH